MHVEFADADEQYIKESVKNGYFPDEEERANAAFVEVNVERMELWIRGVTPEPFGLHTTILERDATAAWRLRAD